MYVLTINKCHCKLLSKALDIYKSTLRGELKRIPLLYAENKKTFLEHAIIEESTFNNFIKIIRNNFFDIESEHYKRYINIIQLDKHGINLTNIKKRLIDTCLIFKNKSIDKIDVKLTLDELLIIKAACELYWNIQISNINHINSIDIVSSNTNDKFKADINSMDELIKLFASDIKSDIMSPAINRKAKWCYDITQTIDCFLKGNEHRLVGSLNHLIIKKYG